MVTSKMNCPRKSVKCFYVFLIFEFWYQKLHWMILVVRLCYFPMVLNVFFFINEINGRIFVYILWSYKSISSEYWKGTARLTVPRKLSPMYWILFERVGFKISKIYIYSKFYHHSDILKFLEAYFSSSITPKERKISPITSSQFMSRVISSLRKVVC